MLSGEFDTHTPQPNFEDGVNLISRLVDPHMVGYSDEFGDAEFPGWDGTVRKLELEPEVAAQTGLGASVRVRIIGDYETGIALIFRSSNLFDTRRFGFYLQPAPSQEGLRGLEVWQAPAQKPQRGKLYWGFELLDHQHARPSAPEVVENLLKSLRRAAR